MDSDDMKIIDASEEHLEEMKKRFYSVKENGFPYLVAQIENKIVGYSYANHYRPREGYKFTVEDMIYIHPDYLNLGIDKKLLKKLIEKLYKAKIKNIIAVIGDSENIASIKFHESLGFEKCGV